MNDSRTRPENFQSGPDLFPTDVPRLPPRSGARLKSITAPGLDLRLAATWWCGDVDRGWPRLRSWPPLGLLRDGNQRDGVGPHHLMVRHRPCSAFRSESTSQSAIRVTIWHLWVTNVDYEDLGPRIELTMCQAGLDLTLCIFPDRAVPVTTRSITSRYFIAVPGWSS